MRAKLSLNGTKKRYDYNQLKITMTLEQNPSPPPTVKPIHMKLRIPSWTYTFFCWSQSNFIVYITIFVTFKPQIWESLERYFHCQTSIVRKRPQACRIWLPLDVRRKCNKSYHLVTNSFNCHTPCTLHGLSKNIPSVTFLCCHHLRSWVCPASQVNAIYINQLGKFLDQLMRIKVIKSGYYLEHRCVHCELDGIGCSTWS